MKFNAENVLKEQIKNIERSILSESRMGYRGKSFSYSKISPNSAKIIKHLESRGFVVQNDEANKEIHVIWDR